MAVLRWVQTPDLAWTELTVAEVCMAHHETQMDFQSMSEAFDQALQNLKVPGCSMHDSCCLTCLARLLGTHVAATQRCDDVCGIFVYYNLQLNSHFCFRLSKFSLIILIKIE